jgi:hypothetical protein
MSDKILRRLLSRKQNFSFSETLFSSSLEVGVIFNHSFYTSIDPRLHLQGQPLTYERAAGGVKCKAMRLTVAARRCPDSSVLYPTIQLFWSRVTDPPLSSECRLRFAVVFWSILMNGYQARLSVNPMLYRFMVYITTLTVAQATHYRMINE